MSALPRPRPLCCLLGVALMSQGSGSPELSHLLLDRGDRASCPHCRACPGCCPGTPGAVRVGASQRLVCSRGELPVGAILFLGQCLCHGFVVGLGSSRSLGADRDIDRRCHSHCQQPSQTLKCGLLSRRAKLEEKRKKEEEKRLREEEKVGCPAPQLLEMPDMPSASAAP